MKHAINVAVVESSVVAEVVAVRWKAIKGPRKKSISNLADSDFVTQVVVKRAELTPPENFANLVRNGCRARERKNKTNSCGYSRECRGYPQVMRYTSTLPVQRIVPERCLDRDRLAYSLPKPGPWTWILRLAQGPKV